MVIGIPNIFHRVTKIKNKTKIISNIRNNDEIISDPMRMTEHIVSYYKSLFFSSNFVLQDQELVDEVIPQMIDDTTNNLLMTVLQKLRLKMQSSILIMTTLQGQMGLVPVSFSNIGKLLKRMFMLQYYNSFKLDGCLLIIMQTL